MARRQRWQKGYLSTEARSAEPVWVYRFSRVRPSDGRRVAAKITIGSLSDFPCESAAWEEVNRRGLETQINAPFSGRITFADLVHLYVANELPKLAFSTQAQQRNNLTRHLLPRWGRYVMAELRPLEVQQWVDELSKHLATATRAKLRDLMHRIFEFGLLYQLIPESSGNPIKRVRCRRPLRGSQTTVVNRDTLPSVANGSGIPAFATRVDVAGCHHRFESFRALRSEMARRRLGRPENPCTSDFSARQGGRT